MRDFLLCVLSFIFCCLHALANDRAIVPGSGKFTLEGGSDRTDKKIEIYYHLPLSYNKKTKVLMVLPGAGRNGWDYRDAWVDASEKFNILILSPSYSEKSYPRFWNYNLARMLDDVKINKDKTDIESYTIINDPKEWIFDDFDRFFSISVSKFNLSAEKYDMFGHSAGGQVLHRFTLFDSNNKSHRIVSDNSGWYTIPNFDENFPYGLKSGMSTLGNIGSAFKSKLTIFLGELDNEHETRGHLVRSPQVDIQGTSRLSRGKYFYKVAQNLANKTSLEFNWSLHIVQGVGHDYKNMSKAAADYLYSE
ncbi:MAG: hypothetical protein K0U59_05115 [Gammaproteobacteria bacterium]|nr:hypothetical protein [Gammaproteobacteria bacterium]